MGDPRTKDGGTLLGATRSSQADAISDDLGTELQQALGGDAAKNIADAG